jgi:hypothetical protein
LTIYGIPLITVHYYALELLLHHLGKDLAFVFGGAGGMPVSSEPFAAPVSKNFLVIDLLHHLNFYKTIAEVVLVLNRPTARGNQIVPQNGGTGAYLVIQKKTSSLPARQLTS